VQDGDTKEDAVRKEKRFLDSLPDNAGIIELSFLYGIDFSKFDGKMKLRDLLEVVQQQQVHWGTFQELVKTEGAETTLEEVGRRYIADRSNYVVGSVKEVADHLEAVHESGGRNGGSILAKSFAAPGMLRDFTEMVVPELQRRGLMRTKYASTTLRGNLNS
jgi:long-chain alkane monooxygenase